MCEGAASFLVRPREGVEAAQQERGSQGCRPHADGAVAWMGIPIRFWLFPQPTSLTAACRGSVVYVFGEGRGVSKWTKGRGPRRPGPRGGGGALLSSALHPQLSTLSSVFMSEALVEDPSAGPPWRLAGSARSELSLGRGDPQTFLQIQAQVQPTLVTWEIRKLFIPPSPQKLGSGTHYVGIEVRR